MSNILIIKIGNEKISITSDDGLLLLNTSSFIVVNEKERILNIGEISGDTQHKSNVRFFNPFLIDDFHPRLAGLAVIRSVESAIFSSSEPQKKILRNAREWHISIDGYERLDNESQDIFEYNVTQNSMFIRADKFFIHNQAIKPNKFLWAEKAVKAGYGLWFGVVGFLAFEFAKSVFGARINEPVTIFSFIVINLFLLTLVYISGLIHLAMCKYVLRDFIPVPVYEAMIEREDLGIGKIRKWLRL